MGFFAPPEIIKGYMTMFNISHHFTHKRAFTPRVFDYTAAGLYEIAAPAGAAILKVTASAGGAGGSGVSSNPSGSAYGSGGGGAGCIEYQLSLNPNDQISVRVGTGGIAGFNYFSTDGENTTIAINGTVVLSLNGGVHGGMNYQGVGGTSTGPGILAGQTPPTLPYYSPCYSGAGSDPLIGATYGVGGTAGFNNGYSFCLPGTCGRAYLVFT